MVRQNLPRFKAESAGGEIDGGTAVGRQLPALHGDGLLKLHGCAHKLFHLAVKTPQFMIELAVG